MSSDCLHDGLTLSPLCNKRSQPGGIDILIDKYDKCRLPPWATAPSWSSITAWTPITNVHSSSSLHSGHSWTPSWHKYLCLIHTIILLHLPNGISRVLHPHVEDNLWVLDHRLDVHNKDISLLIISIITIFTQIIRHNNAYNFTFTIFTLHSSSSFLQIAQRHRPISGSTHSRSNLTFILLPPNHEHK